MDHCSSLICFLEASKNSSSLSFILNFHDNCFTSGDFSTSSLWSFPLCCFLCSNRFSHFLISCLFLFLFSLLEFSACIAQHVFVFCIFFKCFVVGAKSCPTLVTPWTVAHQASLAMGFPRQDYCSGFPFPSPGDLPDWRIKPASPATVGKFFTTETSGNYTHLFFISTISLLLVDAKSNVNVTSMQSFRVPGFLFLAALPLYFLRGISSASSWVKREGCR